jgi:long-chain acyl-CoA synthetase
MSGSSTYYLEKPPTPSVLLPALKKVKPTMILSVPLIIEKIFKNSIYPKLTATKTLRTLYKIPFFRKLMHKKACKELVNIFGGKVLFFGIGGAKLSKQVEQFLIEGKVFPYAIGYGLTETAPLIAGVNPTMVKMQTTGPALNGVEIKIHNPKATTGEGEIWVKGENIMLGYYKEEEITKSVFEDGWFKTGDVGVLDDEGFLSIKSRLKNVIIGASGENIYPEDIESVINSHKLVNESIVLEQKGKLVAMVQLNKEELEKRYIHFKEEWSEKTDKMMMELKEYVNSKVNKISKISVVIPVHEDLERTATQKVKRFKYIKD